MSLALGQAAGVTMHGQPRLHRPLSPEEQSAFVAPFDALIAELRRQLADRGHPCHFIEFFPKADGGEGTDARNVDTQKHSVGEGQLTKAGVVPTGLHASIWCVSGRPLKDDDCDEDDHLAISMGFSGAADPRDDEAVRNPAGQNPRRLDYNVDDPPWLLSVAPPHADAGVSGEPVGLIKFDNGSDWTKLIQSLDKQALGATFAAMRPLPSPVPWRPHASPDAGSPADAERDVLAALIADYFDGPKLMVLRAPKPLKVNLTTAQRKELTRVAPDLPPDLFDAFDRALRQGGAPPVPGKTHIFSGPDDEALFADGGGGWVGFRKRYPGAAGIVTFSRVGVSQDGESALVYVGWQAGWLNGHGGLFFMRKSAAGWAILYEASLWES